MGNVLNDSKEIPRTGWDSANTQVPDQRALLGRGQCQCAS
jgi:hypothetical protein